MYHERTGYAVESSEPANTERNSSSQATQRINLRRADRAASKKQIAEHAEKLKLLGNKWYKHGDYAAAAQHYFLAIQVQGPKPILLSNLAASYIKLEAFDEAEWVSTVALEYEPGHLNARVQRGIARREGLAIEASILDFQAVLRQDPNNLDAAQELFKSRLMLSMGDGRDFSASEGPDYPDLDDSPWQSRDDSDSPESRHVGTEKSPCQWYNRNGCESGTLCPFSHAPDDLSVRDELGRNVCKQFLIGSCKFSDTNCSYSHDRACLPARGWWNYPDQVAAAKELQSTLGDVDTYDLDTELRQHPEAKKIWQRQKHAAVLEMLDFKHSFVMDAAEEDALIKSIPMIVPSSEPFVMLVSLEDSKTFNSINKHFIDTLKPRVRFVQASKADHVVKCLESPSLVAVYATDPAIARNKNRKLLLQLLDYVKVRGGTLVVGGQFASHVTPKEFDAFMKTMGLKWANGSYHRTTFSLNPVRWNAQKNPSLTPSYSMKALHVTGIGPDQAVYRTTTESKLQSLVWAPENVDNRNEAPVAQTALGKGSFGYIGDVNAEDDSTKTVLALLGLLDELDVTLGQVNGNLRGLGDGVEGSSTTQIDGKPGKKKSKKSKKKGAEQSAVQQLTPSISRQDGAAGPSTSVSPNHASPSPVRKSVIVATLANPDLFESVHAEQMNALSKHADVIRSRTPSEFLSHLSNTNNLAGVYIADEGIVQKSSKEVLAKLVDYATKNGGNVVVGGLFPSTTRPAEFPTLFGAFGLRWKAGSYRRVEAAIYQTHPVALTFGQKMAEEVSMKAVSISRLEPHALIYRLMPDIPNKDDEWECPVLQSSVGEDIKGHVGYIGDVNAEETTTPILLAMLGVLEPNPPPQEDRQRFILILRGDRIGATDSNDDKVFLDDMKSKNVEVIHGVSNARAVEHLRSQDLVGVLVSDTFVTAPRHAYLLSKLVEYTMNGGTVIFGGFFCSLITTIEFRNFFLHNFGLNWELSLSRPTLEVTKNLKNSLVKASGDSGKMPTKFEGRFMHVGGITQSMAVYTPLNSPSHWSPKNKVFTSSFVYADVPKSQGGHVGFIGTPVIDREVGMVLSAMLGIL